MSNLQFDWLKYTPLISAYYTTDSKNKIRHNANLSLKKIKTTKSTSIHLLQVSEYILNIETNLKQITFEVLVPE